MASQPNQLSDRITVLVFKDNYAARTFQIPLGWLSRFGFLLWLLIATVVLSLALGAKYYWIARKTDPSRVQGLEEELNELRTKLNSPTAITQPVPTVTVTVTPLAQSPAAPVAAPAPAPAPLSSNTILFTALPGSVTWPPKGTEIPISTQNLKTSWHGKTLRVRFDIQYTGKDNGSQQGRILILARSPDAILSYPSGSLNLSDATSLIMPKKGEYFSVSRFREVKAEFIVQPGMAPPKEVEILILNQADQILVYRKAPVATPTVKQPEPETPSANTPTDSADQQQQQQQSTEPAHEPEKPQQ